MDIRAATTKFLDARRAGDGRHRPCCAGTLVAYAKQLRWFNDFLDRRGVLEAELLCLADVTAYLADLQLPTRKLSPVTIHRRILTLRGYCRWLYRTRIIRENFADDIPSPRLGQRLPRALSMGQARKLLSATMTVRDRAIVALLIDTGIRASECCALDLADLDLEDSSILIRIGKNDNQRKLIFEEETRRLLHEWLTARGDEGAALFVSMHANGEGKVGDRLSSNGLYAAVKRAADEVGLGKIVSPHKLRHTCAVTLLDNDVSLDVVQAVLGHADIKTTLIYTHVSRARLRKSYRTGSPMNSLREEKF